MLQESIYTDVAKATVTVLGKRGQGVLVGGNLILTAAHCVYYTCEGEMALGEHFSSEKIKTCEGKKLRVATLAVEPVSDIAVLGSLDIQQSGKEAEDFEKFCKHTKPVPLCRSDFGLPQKFRVHIYTHKGKWVTGTAKRWSEDAQIFIEADEQIEGGTSGGPIINDSGDLIGIASNFGWAPDAKDQPSGLAPRPHLALPVWVCRKIFGRRLRG